MPHIPPGRRPGPAAKVTAAVLLVIGVVGTLIVPLYARTAPQLGGFPFFYWYQLIWIPLVAILAGLAYLLIHPPRGRADGSVPGPAAAGQDGPAGGAHRAGGHDESR